MGYNIDTTPYTPTPGVAIKFGDETNYTQFDTDGLQSMEGDATVWDDLRVPVSSTKRGGSKDPGYEVFRKNLAGDSQGVFTYFFSSTSEEELYFSVQIPHDYKYGTNLHPHVHWCVDTTPPGDTTVRWGLEYTIANIGDVFPVTETIYTTATDPVTAYTHTLSSFTVIDGSAIDSVSTMLICRVFRDVANDNFADDACLLEIDFHYEIDALGSDEEYIK